MIDYYYKQYQVYFVDIYKISGVTWRIASAAGVLHSLGDTTRYRPTALLLEYGPTVGAKSQ